MEKLEKSYYIHKFANICVKENKILSFSKFSKHFFKKNNTSVEYFSDITEIKEQFWIHLYEQTINTLTDSEEYYEYISREKILAFFYTWLEHLSDYREFIKLLFAEARLYKLSPDEFSAFKNTFFNYVDAVLEEGRRTGELASRKLLDDKLKKMLWGNILFTIKFWLSDESNDFEKTDVAIEKSINLTLDILSRNVADSTFDMAKFLFQNSKLIKS